MTPWERVWVDIWKKLTRGSRKYITIPLFVVLVAVPAAAGFVEAYIKLYETLVAPLLPRHVLLTADEREFLENEEWGLIIATESSQEAAEKRRSEFSKVYRESGHRNSKGQLIWENDLLILRDPRERGRWVFAIDLYPGKSSREAIQDGVIEMIEAELQMDVRGQPLERLLNGSAPYEFKRAQFEAVYGSADWKKPLAAE